MAERRAAFQAQDKLAFLLALVAYLKEHDRVPVAQAAEQFGVSPQQVRDAVHLLVVSGVPGASNAYLPGDLFDIAWDDFELRDEIVLTNLVAIDETPRLSAREASALIAGLQYLSSLPGAAEGVSVAALMDKLTRGASAAPQGVAVEAGSADETLQVIREASAAKVQLGFEYRNAKGERRTHRVDPLRVDAHDAERYLRAWDHDSDSLRTYRVDRMSQPVLLPQATGDHADAAHIADSLFEASADDLEVTLEVVPAALPLLGEYLTDDSEQTEVGGLVRVTVRVAHFHGLKRLVAAMSGLVAVVAPGEARAAVHDWAARGAAQYQTASSDPQ